MTEVAQLHAEVARLRRWLRLDVRGRLIEYLLGKAILGADGSLVVVPSKVAHTLIGHAIGARRETVCRVMHALRDDGYVEQRGSRGAVTLTAKLLALVEQAGPDVEVAT